jgi:hypothetical protein
LGPKFKLNIKNFKNFKGFNFLYVVLTSNSNASETKANESFDNGVFFDIEAKRTPLILKGHGNEPVFPTFLHKSVRHGSLTVLLEPFQFWLRIRGDNPIERKKERKKERMYIYPLHTIK